MKVVIPRWMQMVGLPLLLLLLWFSAGVFSQVIFIFLSAMLIALTLNPLVKKLERIKIPRYIGVLLVFLFFISIIAAVLVLVIPPAVDQLQQLIDRLPFYVSDIGDKMASWKSSLERLNLPFDVSAQGDKLVNRVEEYVANLGTKAVSFSINVLGVLGQIVLVLVISIYMLLDARRISRGVHRLFPRSSQDDADELILSSQRAVTHWVIAQSLLSLLVGVSTGVGIWLLDVLGIWPGGSQYAIFFGAWAGLTEVIPYIGPILGATPPTFIAAFTSVWAVLAVIILFIVIQQLEGNVLVPNIMGTIMGVHPLVVIFAVLAGAQLHGVVGMILALPLVALIRALVVFFRPRLELEKAPALETAGAGDEDAPGS
jgi:predicted PurR-regulated permease PerM